MRIYIGINIIPPPCRNIVQNQTGLNNCATLLRFTKSEAYVEAGKSVCEIRCYKSFSYFSFTQKFTVFLVHVYDFPIELLVLYLAFMIPKVCSIFALVRLCALLKFS